MIALTLESKYGVRILLSGGQSYIISEDKKRHQIVYGQFSSKDLFVE